MRSAKAWQYVYVHRIREIVLPISGEVTFPVTSEGFFKNIGTVNVCFLVESVDASSSASLEQEALPADDDVANDYGVGRLAAVVCCTRCQAEGCTFPLRKITYPPPVPSIDITRCTKADLENADEASISDLWCGDISDTRQLSDFRVGETRLDKLLRV